MASAADVAEAIEKPTNKRIALVIALLALMLAFSEIGASNAEIDSLAANVEASNLWAFFQAKTIRRTNVQIAAEGMEVEMAAVADPAQRERMEKRIQGWRQTAERYETEPETGEGRRELTVRAKASEAKRDALAARNEWFEIASGTLQVAIVLASAAIITEMIALAWLGGALGIAAMGAMGLAFLAPQAVQLF